MIILKVRVTIHRRHPSSSIYLTSVGAALKTATRGAGMRPSEHWAGTIYIHWAGTNLHLPPQSACEAEARAKKTKNKKKNRCKEKPTNKCNNARWSISALGEVSQLFPREQSSSKHTNPLCTNYIMSKSWISKNGLLGKSRFWVCKNWNI